MVDVVVLLVVEVVVDVVLVVVLVGVASAATNAPTQELSTIPSTVPEFPVGAWQSLLLLASSFAKQPFVMSEPPSYFATTLVMQSAALGSFGLLGVSAFW